MVIARTAPWLALLAAVGLASSCILSSSAPGEGCVPAPGSCDAPSPKMSPMDFIRRCLAAPIALRDVCDTSVNRCGASAGIGPVCAFGPDGGVFVAVMSDNDMLRARGWRFSQPLQSFPNPAAIPLDQNATAAQEEACAQAQCAAPCPGVEPLSYRFFCGEDGGDADGNARE
jgi:hypothetical protein